MSYKLFLDDIRSVKTIYPESLESEFVVVRSYDEFVSTIKKMGLPDFISFDNDLGCDADGKLLPDGYEAAKWLVYNSNNDLSSLTFKVHSANPVAKIQIESLLQNYLRFLKENKKGS